MTTILVLVIIAAAVIAIFNKPKKSETSKEPWPVRGRPLMNSTEWKLYNRLQEAMPEHLVLPQVALSQLVDVLDRYKTGKSADNKIRAKVVDFVVLNPDRSVLAAIEYNGPMHERARQRSRDRDKAAALSAAGYRLEIFTDIPTGSDIRARLLPQPTPVPVPTTATPKRVEPTLETTG